jgi:hypothetical protein
MLRRIFGPKRDAVTGQWRLHNQKLCEAYSPNTLRMIKPRRMRWAGHVTRIGDRTGAYRVLVGSFKGKRQLGRPRRRGENKIKMRPQEVGWGHGLD